MNLKKGFLLLHILDSSYGFENQAFEYLRGMLLDPRDKVHSVFVLPTQSGKLPGTNGKKRQWNKKAELLWLVWLSAGFLLLITRKFAEEFHQNLIWFWKIQWMNHFRRYFIAKLLKFLLQFLICIQFLKSQPRKRCYRHRKCTVAQIKTKRSKIANWKCKLFGIEASLLLLLCRRR